MSIRDILKNFTNRAFKKNTSNDVMNMYKRKFLEYKNTRNDEFPLKLSDVKCNFVKSLVSVVMPVYNGENYVSKSIESILKQTYKKFELIVVNDGSTDYTSKILEKYMKIDHRITILEQQNKKIPKALSNGFNIAKGEFYTWTSADNIMKSNFLEKMVQELVMDKECAMVYANMKLIDSKGKFLKRHGWYEYPVSSANVVLPSNTDELNTYANNTIGAAFMYRSSVGKIFGDYSKYRYTLEDYDYWMKINSLFKIKHVSFSEPIYYYRMHEKSLTSQDKKLKITENRRFLMVFDDFRRDFFLSPIVWNVNGCCLDSEEFRRIVKEKEHILISEGFFLNSQVLERSNSICNVIFQDFEQNSQKISIDINFYVYENKDIDSCNYKFCLEIKNSSLKVVKKFKIKNIRSLFSFIDALMKIHMLENFEIASMKNKSFSKKVSIILCTHKESEKLDNCLNSLCNQSLNQSDYEIIFIDNSCSINNNLKKFYEKIKEKNPNIDLFYLFTYIQGLSHARNAGLWQARGEVVLYIDDDSLADINLAKETWECFKKNKNAGIVGGQIILKYGRQKPKVLEKGLEELWSQFIISGEKCFKTKDYGSFPYGANFAAKTEILRKIGGFRTTYGRKLDNYAGGEETAACFLVEKIGKEIWLNPKSKVFHDVEENRYTLSHIYKTAYSGVMTSYRLRKDLYAPFDWSENLIINKIKKLESFLKKYPTQSPRYVRAAAEKKAYEAVLEKMQKN